MRCATNRCGETGNTAGDFGVDWIFEDTRKAFRTEEARRCIDLDSTTMYTLNESGVRLTVLYIHLPSHTTAPQRVLASRKSTLLHDHHISNSVVSATLSTAHLIEDGSMAIFPLPSNIASPIGDNGSDYGSDVDDATADELFSQAESQPMKDVVLESIEEPAIPRNESLEQRIKLRLSRLRAGANADDSEAFVREASVEVEYDEGNRVAFSREFCPVRTMCGEADALTISDW